MFAFNHSRHSGFEIALMGPQLSILKRRCQSRQTPTTGCGSEGTIATAAATTAPTTNHFVDEHGELGWACCGVIGLPSGSWRCRPPFPSSTSQCESPSGLDDGWLWPAMGSRGPQVPSRGFDGLGFHFHPFPGPPPGTGTDGGALKRETGWVRPEPPVI